MSRNSKWIVFVIVTILFALAALYRTHQFINGGEDGFASAVMWVGFFFCGRISYIGRPSAPTNETHVKCPSCRELVIRDADVCKYCRCKLMPQ
jgi:hypothetical protein